MADKKMFKSVAKLHQAFCDCLSEISGKTKAIEQMTIERNKQQEEFEQTIKSFGFLVVKQDAK